MSSRYFSVFMAFVLVFAMIPAAFAEDGSQPADEDHADIANNTPQSSGGSDAAGVGNENNTPQDDTTGVNNGGQDGNDPVGDNQDGNDPGGDNQTGNDPDNDDQNGNNPGNDNQDGNGSDAGNKDDDNPNGDGKDDDENGADTPALDAGYLIVDRNVVWVDAVLVNAEKAEGKWEILLDGKAGSVDVQDNGLYALAEFVVDNPGTHHAVIRFQGTVDGKEVTLEAEKTVKFPGKDFRLEITYDGKRTFGGKMSGVKQAEGQWYIGILNGDGQLVAEHVSDPTTSLSYSQTFKDLKPGTYMVWVAFEGVIDGDEMVVMDHMEVTIKGKGSGGVKDPDRDKPPVIADPDKGEKIIENAKGGKLPVTATNHPNLALLGSLVLLAGLALLKFRTIKG